MELGRPNSWKENGMELAVRWGEGVRPDRAGPLGPELGTPAPLLLKLPGTSAAQLPMDADASGSRNRMVSFFFLPSSLLPVSP